MSAKPLEHSEKFGSIVSGRSEVKRVATGFQFTEGPVWSALEGFLLFSDIPANKILKWSPDGGVSVFREPSGNSNGLTYDNEGRLIICEHGNRCLSRIEQDGAYTVLADRFHERRLNSPNDVVVRSDGMIFFTDPPYGVTAEEKELPFNGVFRLDPDSTELSLLLKDFDRPNGLAFSPDERLLYIADTPRRHIRAFEANPDGRLGDSRLFAEIRSEEPGNPDGMKVDAEGNLYVSAAGGIWIFAPDGELIGTIRTPERPANCAWGGNDWRTLFITARESLYTIRLSVPGIRCPR